MKATYVEGGATLEAFGEEGPGTLPRLLPQKGRLAQAQRQWLAHVGKLRARADNAVVEMSRKDDMAVDARIDQHAGLRRVAPAAGLRVGRR